MTLRERWIWCLTYRSSQGRRQSCLIGLSQRHAAPAAYTPGAICYGGFCRIWSRPAAVAKPSHRGLVRSFLDVACSIFGNWLANSGCQWRMTPCGLPGRENQLRGAPRLQEIRGPSGVGQWSQRPDPGSCAGQRGRILAAGLKEKLGRYP